MAGREFLAHQLVDACWKELISMIESQITGVDKDEFTTEEAQSMSANSLAHVATCPRPILSDTMEEV
jgi:hypothetical protein